ncbi:hypothetical protein SAMN06265371_10563 [Lutibacter agarilyticus]|uniref:C1q domain-containing protein n=1 Tax=Lutibacter agarilyticus TaxID=1109740 RepID=A0A238X8K8_9FLAO|nr:hypothetical protein [Lutibacter agarilyticus]SNR54948.1 hypothetical protein SAMN06265371_10563 [Lutibacter agarilyticus]
MRNLNLKLFFIVLVILFFTAINTFAQVGIGTTTPNASSMLDITSSEKGFLPPRMDTSARDLIGAPAAGLLIYNITTNKLNYYNGTSWQVVETGAGSYVDLTTNQTIAGDKTFTGTLTAVGRLMLPMGEISYFETAGFNLTIPSVATGNSGLITNDNMNKINPGTANTNFVNDMFGTGADSRLTYEGTVGRYFHIALSFSYSPEISKDVFIFAVGKNGLVQDSSKLFITTGNTSEYQSTAMHVLLWLDPTDYIEFFVGNLTSANKYVNIKSFNFVAIGM